MNLVPENKSKKLEEEIENFKKIKTEYLKCMDDGDVENAYKLLNKYPNLRERIFNICCHTENKKVITLYKENFTIEDWNVLCEEFDADNNGMFITCNVDLNSVSQGI